MIIKKIKDKYRVYFEDNLYIDTYEDLIVKYNLFSNDISYNRLKDDTLFYKYYLQCINKLNTKLYTSNDIRKMLIDYERVDEVIYLLEKNKYINDNKYIEAYINDKLRFTNRGINLLKRELSNKGLNIDNIDNNNYKELIYEQIKRISNIKLRNSKCNKYKLKTYLITNGNNIEDIDYILNIIL